MADMQVALGMDNGHAESYSALLSKINISPSSQCVYLLIYSAQVCILWQIDNLETATGRHTVQRPRPETQDTEPGPAGNWPSILHPGEKRKKKEHFLCGKEANRGKFL